VFADPDAADVVALPGVLPAAPAGAGIGVQAPEVQAPEEQRAWRELGQLLGVAAELVAEDFRVRPGGGDVGAGGDPFLGAVDHALQGRTAEVVVGPLFAERMARLTVE
jgi:hypothetical protein